MKLPQNRFESYFKSLQVTKLVPSQHGFVLGLTNMNIIIESIDYRMTIKTSCCILIDF